MAKKKKIPAEFRFYDLPQDEKVLALTGESWIREYGSDVDNMHFHNLYEIGICHYGTGDLIIEDQTYRFDQNMLSCIPENLLHVTNSDKGVLGFWEYLYVDPEMILMDLFHDNVHIARQMLEMIRHHAFFIRQEENPMLFQLVQQIITEMKEKKPYYREAVRGLVFTLFMNIARTNRSSSPVEEKVPKYMGGTQLNAAVEYVEHNYASNFKISELADVCHMSETHFRRVFQERMNMTPVEYINFVRVKKACELIDKTDISMEDVAEKVGFVTPSTFNRNFRRVIGTSPYQWKKRPDNHEGKLLEYKISALKGW